MLLYICPTCGRWQDINMTEALERAMQRARRIPLDQGVRHWPCPAGCGLMRVVEEHERIFVRPPTKEERQEQGINELAQMSQDLGLYD